MYYEVYIDQLFLENLVILALLLRSCAGLMRRPVSWRRIWLASALGAAGMCAVIFFRPFSWYLAGAAAFGLLILAAKLVLGCRNRKETCRGTLYLLAAAAFFGGTFQMIYSIWEPPVLLAAVFACMAAELLADRRRKRMALEECRAKVILSDRGERWELTGFMDTGNHLTEPMTGRPVSILNWQEAEKLRQFRQIQEEGNGYLYIPYHSVGTSKGWMMGIVIEEMTIRCRDREIRIPHPVLAVSREKVSLRDEYQMLLHPAHFPGGD